MNKQALTIVVCLCSWLLLSAFATASELVQRVFTARDGLGNSAIHDMATDDYGFVWLATEEGLYRVSNNVVRRVDNEETQSRLDEEFFVSVTKLDHQHLLAVTEHNAYLYDIRENAFHRFGSPQLFPEFDSGALTATAVLPDGNLLLLSAEGKLWRLSRDASHLQALFMLPDSDDGSWNRLLLLKDGRLLLGSVHHLALYDQQGQVIQDELWNANSGSYYSLYQDSRQRVWISGQDGLYRLNLDSLHLSVVPQIPFLCRMVSEDSNGNLWVVIRGGLLKYYPQEQRIVSYKDQLKQRAGIDSPNKILIDSHGLLWVSGTGNPLAILAEKPAFLLDSITNNAAVDIDTVWSVAADKQYLWLGSNGGIFRINLQTKAADRFVLEGLEPSDSIYHIDAISPEQWLLSTTNGLFVFDKEAKRGHRLFTPEQPDGALNHKTIFNVLHEGAQWWFATNHGLYHWVQGGSVEQVPLPDIATTQKRLIVFGLYRDKQHRLWVGGNKFLGYFNADGGFQQVEGHDNDVLKTTMVNQILQIDDEHFWIGTRSKGMLEFNLNTSEIRSLDQAWQVDCDGVYFVTDTQDFRIVGCPKKLSGSKNKVENCW